MKLSFCVHGSLSLHVQPVRPDFWFRNAPLMRNADIVEDDELADWNFYHDPWTILDLQTRDNLVLGVC